MVKRDGTGARRWAFGTGGGTAMPHVPQTYSLYELYFAAALRRIAARPPASAGADTAVMRQFYIDREFDRFPLHHGVVYRRGDGRALIQHDWLAGTGEATFDSTFRMLTYSGAGTTYLVDIRRVTEPPDVEAIGEQFAAHEKSAGGVVALSPRDTTRARVGAVSMPVD